MCGIGCHGSDQNWKPTISQTHRAPKDGWSLKELPPFITDERLRWAFRELGKSSNNAGGAVAEVEVFLKNNGIKVGARQRQLIRDHGNNEWCTRHPERCPRHKRQQEKVRLLKDTMPWVKPFWEGVNNVLQMEFSNPRELIMAIIVMADELISDPIVGCPNCAAHWKKLTDQYHTSSISTMDDARVWIWKMHNFTREDLASVPFETIAKAWKWPTLEGNRIAEIITALGFPSHE